MSSELELLKQRITELEAEKAKLKAELEAKNSEIPELRKKLAEVEARNVEIEARNAELMKQMIEENNRHDARIEKLEEKQLQNDNTPNNILSNFNSDAVYHEKPLEEKEMDNFLLEAHKKIVSSEIKQRNKKLQRESTNQDITPEPAYVAETNNGDNLDEPIDRSISEKSEISGNFVNKIHNFHDRNIDKSIEDNWLDCDLSSRKDLPENDDFTVPSEQVVERDLMQQLSVPSTSIDTEISLTPPVIDKKQQFSVTAECIVYMF